MPPLQPYVEYYVPPNRRIRVPVVEVIRLMHATYPNVYTSDEVALSDFIVVHWATLHGRDYPKV